MAFEGGKAEGHELEIGSGSFIPGFEDQLVGMKIEEEKEIKVTFPQEYLTNAYEIQEDKVKTLRMQVSDLENAEEKNQQKTAVKTSKNKEKAL